YADYLLRSVSDNEIREGLAEEDKVIAAEKLLNAGIASSRAARALGMSATHFARYVRRLGSPAMREHISGSHLPATDTDNLLEAGASVGRLKELEEDMDRVVAAVENHIALARAKAAGNVEKFDEDKHGKVSKYIKGGQVRQ